MRDAKIAIKKGKLKGGVVLGNMLLFLFEVVSLYLTFI